MKIPAKQPSVPVVLVLVVLLGLVNGLLYLFIVPPWQHYDEPNHFEYAWWLANRWSIPQANDVDTEMRREVARSMVEHHFFDQLHFLPDLNAEGKDIWIGEYSQVNDPFLYYAIVSIPLRVFSYADVTTQLYLGRGVSLLFFLLTIVAAYGIISELTPDGHSLRLLLPFTLALLPGFADLMTSLNNDAGLVLFCSWFLWAVVRLIRRGFNSIDFLWGAVTLFLAVFTKQTGLLMLPVFAIAILFSLLRGRAQRYAWLSLAGLAVLGFVAVFEMGQPAWWYVRTEQNHPVRSNQSRPPLGDYEFQIDLPVDGLATKMVQILPLDVSKNLGGKTVTLGAWLWSDHPVQIQGPGLYLIGHRKQIGQNYSVSSEPEFYAFVVTLPKNLVRAWVIFEPLTQKLPEFSTIYMDGLTLVEGDFSKSGTPSFDDHFGQTGVWGGRPFMNLVRNSSGEGSWIGLRSWIDRLGPKIYPDYGREGLSLAYYTVRDQSAAGWFYRNSIGQLGRTFWGRFGWGNVSLIGQKPYRPLAGLTILGLIGAIVALGRIHHRINWKVTFILTLAIMIVWLATLFRGSSFILDRAHFLPVARYVFPVVIPMTLALVLGWHEWMRFIWNRFKALKPWVIAGYLCLFLGINLYALFSLYLYFIG